MRGGVSFEVEWLEEPSTLKVLNIVLACGFGILWIAHLVRGWPADPQPSAVSCRSPSHQLRGCLAQVLSRGFTVPGIVRDARKCGYAAVPSLPSRIANLSIWLLPIGMTPVTPTAEVTNARVEPRQYCGMWLLYCANGSSMPSAEAQAFHALSAQRKSVPCQSRTP